MPCRATLRARLFVGIAATVAVSAIVMLAVGSALTRRSLDDDARRSLARQVDLIAIEVKGGNRHALRLMIGQPAQQTFSTGPETVFLHWAHRIPTVIDAAGLKAGDRIVIRIRADRGATLTEVEATAAKRVADREPKEQEPSQNAQA